MSFEYQFVNPDKGLAISDTAIALSEKLKNQFYLATSYEKKGLNYVVKNDYKSAMKYFSDAFVIFQKLKNQNGIASYYNNTSLIYQSTADYPKALENLKKAVAIFEQIGDKLSLGNAYGNMGNIYQSLGDFPKALESYLKTLTLSEKSGNRVLIARSLGNIGMVYGQIGDYPKCSEYLVKASDLNEQIGEKINNRQNLNNLGIVYMLLSDYPKSLECLRKASAINEQIGDKSTLINNVSNMGLAFERMGDEMKSLEYYQKALIIANQIEEKAALPSLLYNVGENYFNSPDSLMIKKGIIPGKQYDSAITYISAAKQMAVESGSLEIQESAWKEFSKIYEKQKKFPESLDAYKNYIIIRDSIINDQKKQQIKSEEMQYEFDKKKDSINFEKQIDDAKLKQQTLLAQQQQQQLTLNQQQLSLATKEKDLQQLAYLKTQADLQNEHLEKQQDDKQLTIVQKEKELQKSQVKNLSQQQALSKLKLQQQWLYSIGILILLGLLASYFIYRNRLKEGKLKMELAKEKAEQEKKEAEFQRNLADVSLTALRSQMNPHFIFNCLNSIKLYTTQNDTTAAVEYLTKFSKLIRLVMENSRNDRISLSSELQALRLYIEMEAMRFKEKLQYNINVENNVEADYIEIPPLLLQPYVENAIWHGLMHKEEGGKININVAMITAESLLEINIIDNGIGRERSAELKSKTATIHKSYGMKVTSERIALINQIYKAGANVTIHDVTGADGKPSGTRVTIQIPV